MNEHIKPIPDSDVAKKQQVEEMFNDISKKYDFLNHLLSFGIDKLWRNKLLGSLVFKSNYKVLDMATGTADVALQIAKEKKVQVIGADISEGMLSVGREKAKNKNLDNLVQLVKGDAENIPFDNDEFDICTVAFGVRNFQNLPKGLAEIYRVLKPGGQLRVLEFSKPKSKIVAWGFGLYFNRILPFIGKLVSKSNTAYRYLPVSVGAFPEGQDFCNYLEKADFNQISHKPLSFGISTLYICTK